MNALPAVAVLGLGAMGHAFAANLLKKGFTVYGWNRTPGRGDDLVSEGLVQRETAAQAVSDAQVIIAMLTDGDATLAAIRAIAPSCPQNATFCQMGTIGIQETADAIALLETLRPDMLYLDAPVSGTKAPAENAQILVMASGDQQRAGAAQQVFDAISRGTQWYGDAGNSQKMKLVINAWLISMMQGVAESMQLAKQFGFTPGQLWETLDGGPLAAPYVKGKLEMIRKEDYTPQMQLQHALKDARLALANAPQGTMPMMNEIVDMWSQASQGGLAEQDLAAVYTWLDNSRKA
ncbi:NAD(P)-dependent oxidoreductase [Kluyvera ascorbata]|jgi:3-hydroxyisobutyrate dehydrogenase and related beta-hydroxyacid dehydrogenases|uniref:NAD(P)-dependent oxidoreductase n=1 Tax=Kluyvera ascorbata TaxID=51288 RepID=UPI002AB7F6DD|nr:NAD(P)-dependent oxidoreductase [Kluyvera ascorbata]MDZ4031334.1 NAD(P)-dependent oxidoreductase [Kluyvera ascorbata]HDG1677545.1 NAD(P)-dependent oxidoreductase [Kluyvera ascorbata]HDG1681748.1 NAD(P)-dependent oxidoreductase [Kluyvera ascorbata]HDG1693602.1 NAD(P)-dependent oxidoreductase [Kluyvera ascorbata]HDG1707249.1 NAD(P)-dependent oxidoreductase [Kluyvera ascorbata]